MGVNLGVRVPCRRVDDVEALGTASEGQGRRREVGSEGSLERTCGPTNRNVVGGLFPGASWHTTAKPDDSREKVNGAVVQGRLTFLSGEVCP